MLPIIEQIIDSKQIYIRTIDAEFQITQSEIADLIKSEGSTDAAIAVIKRRINETLEPDLTAQLDILINKVEQIKQDGVATASDPVALDNGVVVTKDTINKDGVVIKGQPIEPILYPADLATIEISKDGTPLNVEWRSNGIT